MLIGPQIRAARALLGWSAAELARRAGVSYSTIQRAEATAGIPALQAPRLFALQRALEIGGVVFLGTGETPPGGPGVRLRSTPEVG